MLFLCHTSSPAVNTGKFIEIGVMARLSFYPQKLFCRNNLFRFGRLKFVLASRSIDQRGVIAISLLVTCSSDTPCCRTPLADPSVKHNVKLPALQLWSPPDFTASPDTSPSKVSQPKDNVTALLGLSNEENIFSHSFRTMAVITYFKGCTEKKDQ